MNTKLFQEELGSGKVPIYLKLQTRSNSGNAFVTIPKFIMRKMDLKKGDEMLVRLEEGRKITFTKGVKNKT